MRNTYVLTLTMILKSRKDRTKRDKRQNKREKKKKKRTECNRYSWSKKNIENNNLYDAWTKLTHDACSNTLRSPITL